MMSLFSEKMLISNRCISGLIKKSWTVSTLWKCQNQSVFQNDWLKLTFKVYYKDETFWLLRCYDFWKGVIFYPSPNLYLGLDAQPEIQILKVN